jgi:hypothetical protein
MSKTEREREREREREGGVAIVYSRVRRKSKQSEVR